MVCRFYRKCHLKANVKVNQDAIHRSGKTKYEHLKPSSGIVISAFYKKVNNNNFKKKGTRTKYKDKIRKLNRKEKIKVFDIPLRNILKVSMSEVYGFHCSSLLVKDLVGNLVHQALYLFTTLSPFYFLLNLLPLFLPIQKCKQTDKNRNSYTNFDLTKILI